jgi:hypothetical protein
MPWKINDCFFKFFKRVKSAFKNVFVTDLEHLRCLTTKESSTEHAEMCW